MSEFADRLALVTGAASGIGLATAQELAARGARLILVDRDAITLEKAAGVIGNGSIALSGDVGDEQFWDAHGAQLHGLHYAVANAGVSGAAPITELSFSEWRGILSVNLDGAFLTSPPRKPLPAGSGSTRWHRAVWKRRSGAAWRSSKNLLPQPEASELPSPNWQSWRRH